MTRYLRRLSLQTEFAVVVLGAFGYFTLSSVLRLFLPRFPLAFSDAQLWGLLAYELPLMALLAGFLYIRGWTPQRLGFAALDPRDTLVGIGLALLVYLVCIGLSITLRSLGPAMATAMAQHTLSCDCSLAAIVAVSIVNPVFEETFVCAYVVTALEARRSLPAAIAGSVALRATYHLYQGPLAVLVTIVPIGLIFVFWYAHHGRIWPLLVAHAVLDFVALASSLER